MLERAQQYDESWNESLMPPPPFPSLFLCRSNRSRSSSFLSSSLSLSVTPVFHLSRSSCGPLPHRSFFLPPFRFVSLFRSRLFARSASLFIHLSPSATHGCPLSRAHPRDGVGEWTNALSAPAAEIKRTGRFLLSPHPNTTKAHRPSVRSFVRPFVPPLRPLSRSLSLPPLPSCSLFLFPVRYHPASLRRESPSKTDRRRLAGESLSPRSLAAKLYYTAFSVSCPARLGGLRASREGALPLLKSSLTR